MILRKQKIAAKQAADQSISKRITRKTYRRGYCIFDSGVYRILAVKWLFPQENATFDALVMSTSEAKML
jgi:hypothetical protein